MNDKITRIFQDWPRLDPFLQQALKEDAVFEDVTTRALIPDDLTARATLVAREKGVICGLPILERICARFFKNLDPRIMVEEGAFTGADSPLADITGPAGDLLRAERTILNFLQKLSGVASLTRKFVEAVSGTGVEIMDTRKTTPGWRLLEKYAVGCGGGVNHRMNLRDQAMIKENHLRIIAETRRIDETEAIEYAIGAMKTLDAAPRLAVEVENIPQLRAALAGEPDIILLDNMGPENISKSLEYVQEACAAGAMRPTVEVSGGIVLRNVRSHALPGVDRISVGALTHSAPALDIAMNLRLTL